MNSPTILKRDQLTVEIHSRDEDLARSAAALAAETIREAIAERGEASVIFATANSQIKFLNELAAISESSGIEWSKVVMFHMDEYLGIPASHPASFRNGMRLMVDEVLHPKTFHYLQGDAEEPLKAISAYSQLLENHPPDLCCLGIGENGHLAFNDPPVADFDDPLPLKIVKLDHACRMQQVGEGHFPDLQSVPSYALTLTIPTLCRARRMLAIVPEKRKATAVERTLNGPIDTSCPGSILRLQPHCTLYLDQDSASDFLRTS